MISTAKVPPRACLDQSRRSIASVARSSKEGSMISADMYVCNGPPAVGFRANLQNRHPSSGLRNDSRLDTEKAFVQQTDGGAPDFALEGSS
jgi:hypothetical protein